MAERLLFVYRGWFVDKSVVIRDLGDDLVLRRATPDDVDALVEFNARVHSDAGWDSPDTRVGAWVRDLANSPRSATKPHPTFDMADFLVMEDVETGAIVSSTCLISQTWSYAGIDFGVGRVELVGTHADYRNRGLIRTQFEVLHRWSADRGHKVQAITGIPYYYRQFGYEMALDMHGSLRGALCDVPHLKDGETEPYIVRPAEAADLDFVAGVMAHAAQRSLVNCVRDAEQWRYTFDGQSPENAMARELCVIESAEGEPVGFLAHPNCLWYDALFVEAYELKPGTSWWDVTPSVMRSLQKTGADYGPYLEADEKQGFNALTFNLGGAHPAYDVAEPWLPQKRDPYAWYIRVADVADFLRTISPVLEARLAKSVMVGYSGELRLNFYRDGVIVTFDRGRITAVKPWEFPGSAGNSAKFPDLTFLHLLFGHHSYAEIGAMYVDCGGRHEHKLLLDALFPKQSSAVWAVS